MKPAWALAACLLLLAEPAFAVLRPPALDSPPDTLELLPPDARDFRLHKHAGNDLHHAGLILGLSSIPVFLLTPWVVDNLGGESPFGEFQDGFFLLTFAALPAMSAVMASGNVVYAGAARYHPEREFAITTSLLPLAAFGLAAGKAFYLVTNPDLADSRGVEKGVLVAFALTELLTIPALRSQFNSASAFLDQVHIRVTGQGASAGLRVEF